MFTFKKPNETGLSDEEKKMAQELNEAIEKHQQDVEDEFCDVPDEPEEKHESSLVPCDTVHCIDRSRSDARDQRDCQKT